MSNIAIILSGGTGTRMGLDTPKQYILVNDCPILHYSIKTFLHNDKISKIIICCAKEWIGFINDHLGSINTNKNILFSIPGKTRQITIYNALKKLEGVANDDDIVIIHDGARPLVSQSLINDCLDGCKKHDGILPVIRMKDTIYLSEDGCKINSLLNRSHLYAGQAPEAFQYKKYYDIHKSMSHEELLKINGSSEIAYKCGLDISMIAGDEMNFKITTMEDLESFKAIINDKK